MCMMMANDEATFNMVRKQFVIAATRGCIEDVKRIYAAHGNHFFEQPVDFTPRNEMQHQDAFATLTFAKVPTHVLRAVLH